MPERNFQNRTLYHGDNLDFLRGMNSGTVNLIATDPPFNKSRDFHATPDSLAKGAAFQDRWSWQDDIHDDWLISIQRDEPEVWQVITAAKSVYGDDMAAFLCWLGVRLLEMHRVLTDDGSLYLHCDATASHYIKTLLDAIFKQRQFRSEIVWQRTGAHSDAKRYGAVSDRLLFYTKSEQWTWNQQYVPYSDEYVKQRYRYDDGDGRLYWRNTMTAAGAVATSPERTFRGRVMSPPSGTHWRFDQANIDQMEAEGRIYYSATGMPYVKSYLDERKGRPIQDVWVDVVMSKSGRERTGYPTQKPLDLYERIIKASSNPGDLVLDPFCGCATTPVAAERLERQWVGIDIWAGAIDVVRQRMADNRQLLTDANPTVTYSTEPPTRTDDGEPATPAFRTPTGTARRSLPPPRSHHGRLLADIGPFCQGCGADYQFDTRVLEVDHINPRSQGGTDAYENLTLLCPPCNKEKRDRYTLIGLQRFNRENGYMKTEGNLRMGRSAGRTGRRRRR